MQSPEYLTLSAAARSLPKVNGKTLHESAIYRWCVSGVRGVRLRHIILGRRYLTTLAWLEEFGLQLAELGPARRTACKPAPAPARKRRRTPAERDRAVKAAVESLARD